MSDDKNPSDVQFFEGAEKLLEIWFSGCDGDVEGDLRKIPRYFAPFSTVDTK